MNIKILKLLNTNVGDMLIKFNNRFEWLCEQWGWNQKVYYVVAVALAIVFGILAMRMIKPICGFMVGVMGYIAGLQFFHVLCMNFSVWNKVPDFCKYILAFLFALVLFVVGWHRCLHAVLLIYAVGGFYLTYNCLVHNVWVSIAGALLVALLAACVIRFAFILAAGIGCAYVFVLALGKLLPKVTWLQLTAADRVIPLCIVATIAILFILVQCETTRSYECYER